MSQRVTIAVVSDIHYAGPAERQRPDYELDVIPGRLKRLARKTYRDWVWLRDPFAHNDLLDRALAAARGADWLVANGDYSCDSGFIGVADPAAYESAALCLGKMRSAFPGRTRFSFGDHELGKKPLGAEAGGLRLTSWERCLAGLELEPLWRLEIGQYELIGVVSSLLALPVYQRDVPVAEASQWEALRQTHFAQIAAAFASVESGRRILLFCHDPSALPFLHAIPEVAAKLPQIERTVLGHLHTKLVYRQSLILAGMPPIRFLGAAVQRMSTALHQAKLWRPFNPLLCPALTGCELLKDGGFYLVELDPAGAAPAKFRFQPLKR